MDDRLELVPVRRRNGAWGGMKLRGESSISMGWRRRGLVGERDDAVLRQRGDSGSSWL